jgi:hypothetical protein
MKSERVATFSRSRPRRSVPALLAAEARLIAYHRAGTSLDPALRIAQCCLRKEGQTGSKLQIIWRAENFQC